MTDFIIMSAVVCLQIFIFVGIIACVAVPVVVFMSTTNALYLLLYLLSIPILSVLLVSAYWIFNYV